jgi:hypothetical protein
VQSRQDPEPHPYLRKTGSGQRSLDCLQAFLEDADALCHHLTFEGGHEMWGYPVGNLYTLRVPFTAAHSSSVVTIRLILGRGRGVLRGQR